MKKKSSANKSINVRPFSSILVDGPERAAARSMLDPVGFTEDDFKKPIIGIASTWSIINPHNGQRTKAGVSLKANNSDRIEVLLAAVPSERLS